MASVKNWHKRFLGNSSSAIWYVPPRMGKNFIPIIDCVKYPKSAFIVPDGMLKFFLGRFSCFFSKIKIASTMVCEISNLTSNFFAECHAYYDALYIMEFGKFSLDGRNLLISSSCSDKEDSLAFIAKKNQTSIQILSGEYYGELEIFKNNLNFPIYAIPKDY